MTIVEEIRAEKLRKELEKHHEKDRFKSSVVFFKELAARLKEWYGDYNLYSRGDYLIRPFAEQEEDGENVFYYGTRFLYGTRYYGGQLFVTSKLVPNILAWLVSNGFDYEMIGNDKDVISVKMPNDEE